ncbi:ADP-ribosyl cyclase/cyclic ADP-ribose hydrolase 1-like [Chaetodon trifascialis]|uniref:ADP-ribosyl cyclase/cyclic ADP-ribose hydrolase 1-like n=1 Tax=Chaetodon trifascialis TaxID=109706 RepID=UPI0039949AF4
MARRPDRKRCIIVTVVVVALFIIVLGLVLGLTLRKEPEQFETTFINRCEKFKGYDCNKLWTAFEQAYVGQDPCKVTVEDYDPFIAAASFKPACNRMMFWSKTKDIVHAFTAKNPCFVTLEDTVLGGVADGLTWCGKEGSSETFTTGCPGWSDCENNTVRSFWNKASAAFADAACGNVTAMLNGAVDTPFSSTSIFGSIEMPRFTSPTVKRLNIVLLTQTNSGANCTNASLKELQNTLAKGITYSCSEMTEAQLQQCSSKPCGNCW